MSKLNSCICDSRLAPLRSMPDVDARIKVTGEILATCKIVERGDWRTLDRCRICGRYWVVESPYSERHGGGPSCAYSVERPEFLRESLTSQIRQIAEDAEFLTRIGPEQGPTICARADCRRLTVASSVLCALHHFEQVKDRLPDVGERRS